MAIAFLGAANAAIVKLTCPFCQKVQARARLPRGEHYACRSCGREFTFTQGTRQASPTSRRRR